MTRRNNLARRNGNGHQPQTTLPPEAFDSIPRVSLTLTDESAYVTRFDRRGHASARYLIRLAEAAQALSVFGADTGLLPEGVLFWQNQQGRNRMGIWLPPTTRTVLFASGRGDVRLTIPLPGFVFIGQGTDYWIWAAPERPTTPHAQLFAAPLPNVHPTGQVCVGNVKFPVCGPATIHRAAQMFFESGFNADLSTDKVDVKGTLFNFLRGLRGPFPIERLIPVTRMGAVVASSVNDDGAVDVEMDDDMDDETELVEYV